MPGTFWTMDNGPRTTDRKIRIGTVPYLNALPLVDGLPFEIYKAPPAILVERAKENEIISAPIVTAFKDASWHLIDGVGIGSFGPVETVKLFFRNNEITIQNLKSISLDQESLTSVALLKVLLTKFYKRSLDSISFSNKPDETDAALLIGDKTWAPQGPLSVVRSPLSSPPPPLDFGSSWTDFTHLPFLFACWMTRSKGVAMEWKRVLIDQAEKNLADLEGLAAKAPQNNCPDLLAYWKRLRYIIDDETKKGVALFQKMWGEVEKKSLLTLNWI